MSDIHRVAESVARTGAVTSNDILACRRAFYEDGAISRTEASALFAIERTRRVHNPEWSQMVLEMLTDYAIRQEPPTHYLSSNTAQWIESEIRRHKNPSSDVEVALVVKLIEEAQSVPPAFSAFALRLVKELVIYGDGVDARGKEHKSGQVSAADIDLLQRILWGAGEEGLLAISREEAEALFSIAHMTAGADNDPRFDAFFAKAVGNYLTGATGRQAVHRDTVYRWQTEVVKPDPARMLNEALFSIPKLGESGFITDTIRNARTLGEDLDHTFHQQNEARDAMIAAAEVLTPEKTAWLRDHVDQNGRMTAPEKALMQFLAKEARKLDPSLNDLLAKAG